MIDIRKLKELVKLMVENDLSELDLKDEQEAVSLRRPYATSGVMPAPQAAPVAHAAPAQAAPAAAPAASAPADSDAGLTPIESPMVGTFYSAPDPESPAFVTEGSKVTPDTVVCVIEAMKVFSEIKAGVAGTVKRVAAKNAEAVEYGQPLFFVSAD